MYIHPVDASSVIVSKETPQMLQSQASTRRFLTAASAVALASLFIAGCSATESGEGVDATPLEPGTIGTSETSDLTVSLYALSAGAPIFLGVEEGIYESYDLNVEPSIFTTVAEGSAALQAGESQMYYTNLFGVVNAINAGIDLRIVTEVLAASPEVQVLAVMPDSEIEDVLDLQGKKIALPAVNSSLDATLNATMKNLGGDFATIEYVQLPYVDMPAALEQGTVDAAIITGPPLTIAQEELDARTVWDVGGGEYDGLAQVSYVTSKEFAEANPTTIANFQCAYAEATEVIYEDRETYLEDTAPYLGITPDELDVQTDFNWIHGFRPEKLDQISDVMLAAELISEPFDLNAISIPFPESCD